MAEIRSEGFEVETLFGVVGTEVGHAYLVYVDDFGNEFVIRGGKLDGGSTIDVEIGVPMANSADMRANTDAAREARGSQVLDLGGRDPALVWTALLAEAARVNGSDTNYDLNGPNSNTVFALLLTSEQIDVAAATPTIEGVDGFLGFDAWEGVGDVALMNQLPEIVDLEFTAAAEYYEAKREALENSLASFYEEGELPEFAEDDTVSPEFSTEKTQADYVAQLDDLANTYNEIQDYKIANSDELSDEELAALDNLQQAIVDAVWLASNGLYDPLVLDLDGDGIETTSIEDTDFQFDLFEGSGFVGDHGWLSSDDGFLALDKNGNGRIDSISELFGDHLETGFEDLASLDSNSDGKIDSSDELFSSLVVWQDLNENGQSEEGELTSVSDIGIVSISLSNEKTQIESNGNTVTEIGSVTLNDGTEMLIADVNFATDFSSFETNQRSDVFDFSNLSGSGRLLGYEDELDFIAVSNSDFDSWNFQETSDGTIVDMDGENSLFIAGVTSEELTVEDFMFV